MTLEAAFAALLAVYVAHALSLNLRRPYTPGRMARNAMVALHSVLFAAACWFGWRDGVFGRPLVSPVHIAAGLAGGHAIFGVSLVLTQQSWRDVALHFFDLGPLWNYMADNPRVLLRFTGVAAAEELVYRVAAQPLAIAWTGSAPAGILLIAAGFSVVHQHFFKAPPDAPELQPQPGPLYGARWFIYRWSQSIEFVVFAILLGVLYHWTHSLILVVAIHAIRNIEIAYLEEIVEGEDETAPDASGGHAPAQAGEQR